MGVIIVATQIAIERILPRVWPAIRERVILIEQRFYEPTRRDTSEFFEYVVNQARSVSFAAFEGDTLVGFCFAGPLELFGDICGVATDPEFGKNTTLYSADVTVAPEYQSRGIGQLLKLRQIGAAEELGYSYIAGRNRVGFAKAMRRINETLGPVTIQVLKNDYPDDLEQRDCIYYHIHLKPVNAGAQFGSFDFGVG